MPKFRPRPRHTSRLLGSLGLAAILLSGCGGGNDSGPTGTEDPDPEENQSTMSATVNGQPWTPTAEGIRAEALDDVPGGYRILGTYPLGAGGRTIDLELYNIDAPGTYPLGVNATVFGGYASVQNTSGNLWHTRYSGASGEVVVTEVAGAHIVGTFSFTATPFPSNPATGSVDVTAGAFDAMVEGTVLPVPDDTGSSLTASFGGTSFTASTIAVTLNPGRKQISVLNTDFNMLILLDAVEAPGVYPLALGSPMRTAAVTAGNEAPAGTNCCWTSIPDAEGQVTVATLTENRMTGSFEMRLLPQPGSPAGDTLAITTGTFDLGLVQR